MQSKVKIQKNPFVLSINKDVYINVEKPNTGIFVKQSGEKLKRKPIKMHLSDIKKFVKFKSYLIVVFQKFIQIFNTRIS